MRRFLIILTLLGAGSAFAGPPVTPRLVLQITVDQLRGDLPHRYLAGMGEGGFRYLLANGVVYEDAHHAHSNTETIVGHTTLATGAHPAAHGLVGNVWFDRTEERMVYNIEDSRYPLLTSGADVDRKTEIDPTQRAARSEGRSPATILVSTFGDELAIHTGGAAKVFGVSVKDRGAVSMAGHAGTAYWFSKAAGEFVTSTFYLDAYPDWVVDFNANDPAGAYAGTNWELMDERETYIFGDQDDQPWETSLGSFGRVFPHAYGPADDPYFTTYLTLSPAGDEMTLAFAKELLVNEGLGNDEVTDYLSVSISSTDYVGHIFGPSSLEAEDNLRLLDRSLADVLSFVDEQVGLDQTLVVLSADHGGPEPPPQLQTYGLDAHYVDPDSWDKEAGIARLKDRFGVGEELIDAFFPPYVYLNREVMESHGLDATEVEEAVAREIMKFEGVSLAISSHALTGGGIPVTPLTESVLHSHNPRRSGDVFVVFEPNWFINDFDGLEVATTHGSPWRYDTFVPVIFAGMDLEPRRVARRIHTTDVATTISAFVGTKRPSGSSGQVLPEVVR